MSLPFGDLTVVISRRFRVMQPPAVGHLSQATLKAFVGRALRTSVVLALAGLDSSQGQATIAGKSSL